MKQIDVMRSLMYKLDRKTLNTMYITFVRPILEYTLIVWLQLFRQTEAKP